MAIWEAYVLLATLLLLTRTGNGQRGYELEVTTRTNPDQLYRNEEMSEEHDIKVGNKIEPIIFEPQRKIKLSQSTYKVTSYVDFKPYKQAFKQFGQYIRKFSLLMVFAHNRPINVEFKTNLFSLEMKQIKYIRFTWRLIGNS